MKDRLEDFVQSHKDEFDVFEPPGQLWDKIQKRKPEAKIRHINWTSVMWKAAAVIIIFSASFIIQRYFMKPVQQNVAEQTNTQQTEPEIVIPEVAEAQVYYTNQLDSKLSEINRLADCYPELKSVIDTDFSELDSTFRELKEDLKDDAANEEVINAMIQNYRLKLQILEDLLYQVKKLDCNESTKDEFHEKDGVDI